MKQQSSKRRSFFKYFKVLNSDKPDIIKGGEVPTDMDEFEKFLQELQDPSLSGKEKSRRKRITI